MRRSPLSHIVLIVGVIFALSSSCTAQNGLVERLNGGPHTAAVEVMAGRTAVYEFDLATDHGKPVYFFVQAMMRFRAVSNTAGIMRIYVNDTAVGPKYAVNKAATYMAGAQGAYVGNAYALPAQPEFATSDRSEIGGLGYLFDITEFVKPGANTVSVEHAATTEDMLLRDATFVTGEQVTPLSGTVSASVLNDPTKLNWDFSLNIQDGKGLFIIPGSVDATFFYVRNEDATPAVDLGMIIDLPAGVTVRTPYMPYRDGWTDRIGMIEAAIEHDGRAYVRYTITLPEEAAAPAQMSDFAGFGGHALTLYLECDAQPGDYSMYWQSTSAGGEGTVQSAPLTIMEELPPTPQPQRSRLGLWAYRVIWAGVSENEKQLQTGLRSDVDAWLARCGVSRLVLSDAEDIADAHANGMITSWASPWSYDRTVFPEDTADLSKARYNENGEPYRNGDKYIWCPTYAAENGEEVYGLITKRIADEGWDGFDLDHEGNHYQCFCDRCKHAFAAQEGIAADQLDWPADVLPDGKLHAQWVRFHVRNVGHHVREINKAVKRGNANASLFSWFVASQWEHDAIGRHAEIYADRLAGEREYGYDIREFMKYLDYANMANGVYPQDESTWAKPYGLSWAFNRVESMLESRTEAPLAPCLNIGWGNKKSATWTNFDYLRWQAKTHIAQGVKGLDSWMLPFYDGRHYKLFSDVARLFDQTEDIVWDGQRADDLVTVDGPDKIFSRAFAGDGRLMVGITNNALKDATVRVQVPAEAKNGKLALSGETFSGTVTVPPLDGVFIVFDMP